MTTTSLQHLESREALKQFLVLEDIFISSLWKHDTIECAFCLKKAYLYKEKRDVERAFCFRYAVVDEAGLNTHITKDRT